MNFLIRIFLFSFFFIGASYACKNVFEEAPSDSSSTIGAELHSKEQTALENNKDQVLLKNALKTPTASEEDIKALIEAIHNLQSDKVTQYFENIPSAYKYLPDSIVMDTIFSLEGYISLMSKELIEGNSQLQNVLEILISKGWDINAQNKDGDTVLHAFFREPLMAKFLDEGLKETRKYWSSKSRFMEDYLISSRIIGLLLHLGADPHIRGKDGDTLEHTVARSGNVATLRALYDAGIFTRFVMPDSARVALDKALFNRPHGTELFVAEQTKILEENGFKQFVKNDKGEMPMISNFADGADFIMSYKWLPDKEE